MRKLNVKNFLFKGSETIRFSTFFISSIVSLIRRIKLCRYRFRNRVNTQSLFFLLSSFFKLPVHLVVIKIEISLSLIHYFYSLPPWFGSSYENPSHAGTIFLSPFLFRFLFYVTSESFTEGLLRVFFDGHAIRVKMFFTTQKTER